MEEVLDFFVARKNACLLSLEVSNTEHPPGPVASEDFLEM